ncbi:MAG: hypothetical protein KGZ39_02915 [Simkania sp.]|nr:hypothetical protein [Simkania sp.]
MSYLRNAIWFCITAVFAVVLAAFARRETYHFSTDRLVSVLPYHAEWEFEEAPNIEEILSQSFHYYDKGGQSWVFLSEDSKWVLKFFDFRSTWHDVAKHLHCPTSLLPAMTERQLQSRESPVKSYALAFQRFKEPCGLVGAYLNGKKSGITSLNVFNPIHCKHTIDLKSAAFVVQKKADTILPKRINDLLQKGEMQEANILLSKALMLIAERCSVGIADNDRWHLHRNIGFIAGKAIYLDAGAFLEDTNLLLPKNAETEILHSAELLIDKIAKDKAKFS